MISPDEIDRYSIPLEQQMMKIGRLQPAIEDAFLQAKQTCQDNSFIDDAYQTFESIGGKPGDAALEVYRDLKDNIATLNSFLKKYKDKRQNPNYSHVIEQVENFLEELRRLDDLVKETPPEVMKAIKDMVKQVRYMTSTDEEKHEFKGSSIVMAVSFLTIILLRYFEVIKWSWYIVVPIGIAVMVIVPALISMIRFMKRGY